MSGRRTAGLLALLAAGLVVGAAPAHASEREVLATAKSAAALPPGARPVAQPAPGLGVWALPVPVAASAEAYADRLRRRPGVLGAQPDHRLRATALFNVCVDTPLDLQALVPSTVNSLSAPLPARTKPVAVLDTGVAADTPELAGRVLTGLDATRNTAGATIDDDGHGTQVAAVAAGAPGLFQGVSPTSPVLPVNIFPRDGSTSVEWVVRAIQYAVRGSAGKAGVINISASNPRADLEADDVEVLAQTIAAAYAQDVITVVAAGNEGKGDLTVPGSLPHVLNVGSAGLDGNRDSFSNFGPFVDLVSPGNELIVPAPRNVCASGFGRANGTSFSAPAVAGAVALIRAARPKLTTQQAFDLVRTGAVRALLGKRNDDTGYGMLDVGTGLDARTPAKEPRELDDDLFWFKGIYAKKQRPYLRTSRYTRLKRRLSITRDPQDVFRIDLRKGETLRASVTTTGGAIVDVGIWDSSTGDFDIGQGRTGGQVTSADGLSESARASYRAKRSGRYYVSVEAPELPEPKTQEDGTTPTDQTTQDQSEEEDRPVAEISYTVTLRKLRARRR